MAFDAHKNLAIATVVTAPSPAASGTSLVVGAGQGARFPAVPFNCTISPVDMAPDPTTAEVVRVTARSTDTLTIVRAQEGTTARTVLAGDLIAATITALSLTDIESGTNFPLLTTGAISGSTGSFSGTVTAPTLNGAVTGGTISGTTGTFSGAVSGTTGTFSGTVTTAGLVGKGASFTPIGVDTVDGADTKFLGLSGGGAFDNTRGALVSLYGNEASSAGALNLIAGDCPTGAITFFTTPGYAVRGKVHPTGGLSWGSATDPATLLGARVSVTQETPVKVAMAITGPGSGDNYPIAFYNASGQAGYILTTGTTTSYGTTSDARLKTSHGPHTDLDVLRRTVIHAFTWRTDGTTGRGVFAQEAYAVAPFAVSVGTDDVDAEGRLTKPWGVDYSKYVPDLITGWQAHDAAVRAMEDRIAFLEGVRWSALYGTTPPPEALRMTLMQRLRASLAVLFPAWITP